MDLIKSTDSKYEEYENLLLERDQITKEAGQIWTVYLQLFGKLITDNYEEKLECIKCKKTIAYYQNALNHGGVVDSAAMEKYMEQEMAEYYANLRSRRTKMQIMPVHLPRMKWHGQRHCIAALQS